MLFILILEVQLCVGYEVCYIGNELGILDSDSSCLLVSSAQQKLEHSVD